MVQADSKILSKSGGLSIDAGRPSSSLSITKINGGGNSGDSDNEAKSAKLKSELEEEYADMVKNIQP